MAEIKDFNAARLARAMSERRFHLGGYTFKRQPTIPLAVITDFAKLQSETNTDGVDRPEVILGFEDIFLACTEAEAWKTADETQRVATKKAWKELTTTGDENGPVGLEDLAQIVQWLLAGIAETPTEGSPASLDGSATPVTGQPSTLLSSSEDATSNSLTPAAP